MSRIKQYWEKIKQKFQIFKDWQHANIRVFRISFVTFLLSTMGILLVGTKFAPQQITVNGLTDVGSELSFNDSNGYSGGSIKLLAKKYNPREKIMVLEFKTERDVPGASAVAIPAKNLDFSLTTVNPQQATMQVVPTTSDHLSILIRNLTPKYGAMRISITNNTPASFDEKKAPKEDRTIDFKFKADMQKQNIDSSLTDMSQKDFAIEATKKEISSQKSNIKKHKLNIANAQKIINTDQSTIEDQQKEYKYKSASGQKKIDDTIESLKDDVDSQEENIEKEKKNINTDKERIELLNQQILDIQSGKYKLAKTIKSIQSKELK